MGLRKNQKGIPPQAAMSSWEHSRLQSGWAEAFHTWRHDSCDQPIDGYCRHSTAYDHWNTKQVGPIQLEDIDIAEHSENILKELDVIRSKIDPVLKMVDDSCLILEKMVES